MDSVTSGSVGKLFIAGASRGLGHAIAKDFLERGWDVIGTFVEVERTMLHDLADEFPGRLRIEHMDVCDPGEIGAVRAKLADETIDFLFINAGVQNAPSETPKDVAASEFLRVMLTNALGPMRVIEALEDLVAPAGTIGVMSSGQGSVSGNETGGLEIYRSSKASLNMFMRSYAARHAKDRRSLLVMAPGWVRTQMTGPEAPLSIEESIPKLVGVILENSHTPGLKYLDYRGRKVSW